MRIAIVGASGAGCFAALLLGRAGHDILILDKDRLELAPDVEAAAAHAFRSSAPQIVQPHIIMARCRQLLLKHLPDVHERAAWRRRDGSADCDANAADTRRCRPSSG